MQYTDALTATLITTANLWLQESFPQVSHSYRRPAGLPTGMDSGFEEKRPSGSYFAFTCRGKGGVGAGCVCMWGWMDWGCNQPTWGGGGRGQGTATFGAGRL